MTDHKAGGIVRNAFSRKSRYLRRNTRASKWVPTTPRPKMDDSLAKRPRLVHQTSLTSGEQASLHSVSPVNPYVYKRRYSDDGIDSIPPRIETNFRQKARRHSSPDTPVGLGIYGLPQLQTAWVSPLSVSENTFSYESSHLGQSPFHYDNALPITSYGLPAHPVSGLQRNKVDKQNVYSVTQQLDVQREVTAASIHTPRPTPDRQPPLAPRSKLRQELHTGKEKIDRYIQTASSRHKHPPIAANQNGKKSRKKTNQETMNSVYKTATRIKKVYITGPKGEGQKLWNGIRGKRDEKRELNHSQVPFMNRSPRTQAAIARAQEEQLLAVHAAAAEFSKLKSKSKSQARPKVTESLFKPSQTSYIPRPMTHTHQPPQPPIKNTSPLRSNPVPAIPDRPEPLGLQRSPVLVERPPSNSRSFDTPSAASTSSIYSFDVPVTASRSVEFDGEGKVDMLKFRIPKDRVPKLHQAPKPRGAEKKGLPPRPVPALGEREPSEVREQEKMYNLRVGKGPNQTREKDTLGATRRPVVKGQSIPGTMSASKLNSNPKAAVAPTLAVGSHFHSNSTIPSKSQNNPTHFGPPGLRQTFGQHAPVNKETKHKIASAVSNFLDASVRDKGIEVPIAQSKELFANIVTARQDKARAKHQQKLKQAISAPKPLDSFASHIPTTAPATKVEPQIPNKNAKRPIIPAGKLHTSSAFWKGETGEEELHVDKRIPPPVPPLPQDRHGSFPSNQADLTIRTKGKEKKANWAGAVYGKYAGRSRRDSDASMVCAEAKKHETYYRSSQEQMQYQEPKHSRGSSILNGFHVFQGPAPGKQVAQAGPSRKMEQNKRFSDEYLVPAPLRNSGASKRETRDTMFYGQVDSLLGEYSRRSDDSSKWI